MALFFVSDRVITIDKKYQARVCYPVTGANSKGVKEGKDKGYIKVSDSYINQSDTRKNGEVPKKEMKKSKAVSKEVSDLTENKTQEISL